MGIWHVPFKGRNHSGAQIQNFLWQEGNVYIMDNHRAAWWCWLPHIGYSEPVHIYHVDKHRDANQVGLNSWISVLPTSMCGIPIRQYLEYTDNLNDAKNCVIRWDNYLSLFIAYESHRIHELNMATHGEGDNPKFKSTIEISPWELPSVIDVDLSNKSNWIVNIDLDYFFMQTNGGDYRRFLSTEYVEELCKTLKRELDRNISVLTICLTPDDTGPSGGWSSAEALCAEFCAHLGIKFSLP